MSDTPLYSALKQYIDKDKARFHMPGHKGQQIYPFGEAMAFDLTEIQGTDNLYEASEAILETEQLYSQLYGTKRSILSAGGSTLCIQTMLALVAKPKGKIIAGRSIHIAAVNAMALLGLEPVWVYPDGSAGADLAGRISPQAVEAALIQHPDAAAVYVTSPDYFGVLSDIGGISAVCKAHHVPLLVDNAHGAALKFLSPSLHPMDFGADMCCDSLHKTLPVLTGGAILHIAREDFISNAKSKMALFGSTSPSYLILLSIDRVLGYLQTDVKGDLRKLQDKVQRLENLALEKGFTIPLGVKDPLRFTLGFGSLGYTRETFGALLEKHQIEQEYLSQSHVVLLPSICSRAQDYERLEALLADAVQNTPIAYPYSEEQPLAELGLREALFAPHERISIGHAEHRISGEVKITCPPGIPIVMPGERITAEIKKMMQITGISHVNVLQYR